MSLNTAHANNGVLIHSGEAILLFSSNVTIEFSGQDGPMFKGTKQGSAFLTTHRMIFNSKKFEDAMKSFSFPFICLNDVEVEQPLFGANYIRGKVRAQPDGNFIGEAKFKLNFKQGGAIEFAQAMLRAAHMAQQNAHGAEPPPYTPPSGDWHPAPPPAYTPTPGYYGWLPNSVFPNNPDPNQVFMHDTPPPYPGIVPNNPPPAYPQGGFGQPNGSYSIPTYPSHPNSMYPQAPYGNPAQSGGWQQPSYPPPTAYPQPNAGYPQSGYAQGGYGQPNGGYPGGYPSQPSSMAAPYGNPAQSNSQDSGWQRGATAGGYAPPPNM